MRTLVLLLLVAGLLIAGCTQAQQKNYGEDVPAAKVVEPSPPAMEKKVTDADIEKELGLTEDDLSDPVDGSSDSMDIEDLPSPV